MNEPTKRTDSIAAVEETPVNRIALSWPEPSRQSEALELDFAVTARALRNPVRDVSNETPAAELQKDSSVRASVIERIDSAHADTAKVESATTPAAVEGPASEKQDIRIAAQYPPIQDFPIELRTPATPVAVQAAATPQLEPQPETPDAPVTTGSVADVPDAAPQTNPLPANREPTETKVANRPDPADTGTKPGGLVQQSDDSKPAAKPTRKSAPKKATPARAAKRPARITRRPAARPITPFPGFDTTFPLTFLGHRFPN